MRLFIAVNLSREADEKLETIKSSLSDSNTDVNFANEYHLTLKF